MICLVKLLQKKWSKSRGGALYSFSFWFRKLAKRGGGGYPQALPEVVTLSQSFLDHKVLQKDVCKKSMHSPQVS